MYNFDFNDITSTKQVNKSYALTTMNKAFLHKFFFNY